MNKYADRPTYFIVKASEIVGRFHSRWHERDHVMVLRSPTPEIRRNHHEHKIVACCPTSESANAALRLLSGECEQ